MLNITARITQERKWGRYTVVWMIRLYFTWRHSFNSRAKITDATMTNTSFPTEITTVLRKTLQNVGSLNSRSKFLRPTNLDPNNPLIGMKSWNAISRPPMGTRWKIIRKIIPGSIIR